MKALLIIPVVLGLLFSALPSIHAQLHLHQSENIKVTLDGSIDSKEWSLAKKIVLEEDYNLYLMADSESLYLAAFGTNQSFPYTYLYFKTANCLANLHASMQLGERALPEHDSWDDEKPAWNWGNNQDWSANTVRYKNGATDDHPFHQQIESYQGQEFRISRDKLGSSFSVFVLIRDFMDTAVQVSYPLNGNANTLGSWIEISLEG